MPKRDGSWWLGKHLKPLHKALLMVLILPVAALMVVVESSWNAENRAKAQREWKEHKQGEEKLLAEIHRLEKDSDEKYGRFMEVMAGQIRARNSAGGNHAVAEEQPEPGFVNQEKRPPGVNSESSPPRSDMLTGPSKPGGDQQQRLRERDLLGEQVKNLRVAGKSEEALALADKILAIDQKIFGKDHALVAQTLALVALIQVQKDDFASARKTCREVLVLETRLHGPKHWRVIDAQSALDRVAKVAALSVEKRRQLVKAWQLHTQAEDLIKQKRLGPALPLAEEAAQLRKNLLRPDDREYCRSLITLGRVHHSLPKRDETALAQVREEVKLLVDRGDKRHPEDAVNLYQLAFLYLERGPALAYAERAAEIFLEMIEATDLDYAPHLLAVARWWWNDRSKAEALTLKAAAIYKATGRDWDSGYADCLHDLSAIYMQIGGKPDYTRAEEVLKELVELQRRSAKESPHLLIESLQRLAAVYRLKGVSELADPLLKEIREIQGRLPPQDLTAVITDRRDYPRVFSERQKLVRQYFDRREFAKVRDLYQTWLENDEKVFGYRHPDDLAGLARAAEGMGEPEKALALWQERAEFVKSQFGEESRPYANALRQVESIRRWVGNSKPTERLAHKSSPPSTKDPAERGLASLALLNQAGDQAAKGEDDQAEKLYQTALDQMGSAVEPRLTISMYVQTLAYARNGGLARAERLLLMQVDYCNRYLDNVFPVQSERQRLETLRNLRDRLDFYLQVACAAHPTIPAQDLYRKVLAWKNIAAHQPEEHLSETQPEIKDLVDRLRKTRAELAQQAFAVPAAASEEWSRQLVGLRNDKENLETTLSRRSEDFRRREKRQHSGPAEVAAALPADVVLLDFFEYAHRGYSPGSPRTDRRILAFILRHNQEIACVELKAPAAGIAAMISDWRAGLLTGNAKKMADAANTLNSALWQPLQSYLGGAKTILVVPDGALTQFPFAALPGREPGSYLIEDVALGYLTSGRQVVELFAAAVEHETQGLLAVGGIDYDADLGNRVPSAPTPLATNSTAKQPEAGAMLLLDSKQRAGFMFLPGTELEARRSRELFVRTFSGARAELLSGSEPTKIRIKNELARRYRFVHLATHGFFESPQRVAIFRSGQAGDSSESGSKTNDLAVLPLLRSCLALAGASRPAADSAKNEDGILTAEEVEGFDLRGTELVVLSACDTGLGNIELGQGVLGLQRAFHSAGAQTLITSLWKLEDAATSVLIEEFYTNLWQKKMPKLEALRQAQLTVLRNLDRVQEREKELQTLPSNHGEKRGVPGGKPSHIPGANKPSVRADPILWAAFVLSGDIR
jgi:CHAT domain-containing protein